MFKSSPVSDSQLGGYYAKDDYYMKNFTQPLEVFGQGSKDKNLGAVKSMDQRIFFASLVKNRECKAHDLTFSPPKSLSIMWAIGTDAQQNLALAAHRVGVAKAMGYIEGNLFFVQRKQNNIVKTFEAGGMVALNIDHSVSRPVEAHGVGENDTYQDPQIHSHVLLANAGYIKDDKKKINRSVNFYQIYRGQKQIDRIYKMAMRRELEKAGCKTRKTENGFELIDISNAQNRHFSNRAIQVEKNLAQKGLTRANATGGQSNTAALTGRLKKLDDDKTSSSNLREEWKVRADQMDVNLTWVPFENPAPEERDEKAIFRVIRKAFQEHIAINPISTRGKAIYDILDFAESAHEDNPGKNPMIDFDDVIQSLTSVMKLERMIRLPGQKETQKSIQEQFVSVDLMLRGQENLQYLIQGKGIYTNALTGIAEKMDVLAKDMFKTFIFEGEQRSAALGILEFRDLVTGIQGDPGTGKTTIMKLVAAIQGRENMIALSTAGSAAQKLGSDTEVEANTIAKFLIDWQIREDLLALTQRSAKQEAKLRSLLYLDNLTRDPSKPGLIIIDEASMTGDMDFNKIALIAKKTGSKIILAGDINQLPGVQAGETFKKFQLSGHLQTFELKNINRQKDERYKKIVEAITKKDSAKMAVDALQEIRGAINVRKTARGRIDLMIRDYMKVIYAGESNPMVITGTNDVKDIMNHEIREELKAIGRIDVKGETHMVKCGTRGAKKEREFCVNDRILFLQNDNAGEVAVSSGPKVLNGSQAVITSIKEGFVQGYLIDEEGQKTDVSVSFDLASYDRVDHAFAITTYKSQGQSVRRKVMYHAPSSAVNLNKQDFLVGISRNKNTLSVYTDNINNMIKKISQLAYKDDAYQAFRTGYEFSGGQSEYVRKTFKAVEDKLNRDEPIMTQRQAVTEKYGKLKTAPRAIRDSIVDRMNESRSIFMQDLEKAQELTDSSSHLSDADDALIKAYKAWEKDKNEALRHFDKNKNINRHITYYRALNRASAKFCENTGKMQGHKQSDEVNQGFYQEILAEINDVRTRKIVFPELRVIEEPTVETMPTFTEEDLLNDRMEKLYDRRVLLAGLGDEGRRRLVMAKAHKQAPKLFENYMTEKDSLKNYQIQFDALQKQIDILLGKIEKHELTKDGKIGHFKRMFNPGEAATLDLWANKIDKYQKEQNLLNPKMKESETIVSNFEAKANKNMENMKKAHGIEIKNLDTEIQEIEDKLIVLNPPKPIVCYEDIVGNIIDDEPEEESGLRI